MEYQPSNRGERHSKRGLLQLKFYYRAIYMRERGKKESEVVQHQKEMFKSFQRGDLEDFEDLDDLATSFTLSEVYTRPIHWLWPERIPFGKITILDGDPGLGKSLLAMTVAAHVTTRRPLPGAPPDLGRHDGVILIAPEDSPEDTIKPRMEAAGCDPSKVLVFNTVISFDEKSLVAKESTFTLSRDLLELESEIKRHSAALVIIDPLMAVLGRNIDSSRDQDVREVLTPLAQMAERTDCAILIIRHLNKGNSPNNLYRGAGSIGIIAAARIGLLVAQDPVDEQKRVLATIKNNLSKPAPNLSFQIVENEHSIPYIQWLGENHHPTSTLLRPAPSLSFERQEILRALKESSTPLDAKELADQTGLKYQSLRSILNRMQSAQDIVRLHRGKYTSPNHPSITPKNPETNTDTPATTATTATNPTTDLT